MATSFGCACFCCKCGLRRMLRQGKTWFHYFLGILMCDHVACDEGQRWSAAISNSSPHNYYSNNAGHMPFRLKLSIASITTSPDDTCSTIMPTIQIESSLKATVSFADSHRQMRTVWRKLTDPHSSCEVLYMLRKPLSYIEVKRSFKVKSVKRRSWQSEVIGLCPVPLALSWPSWNHAPPDNNLLSCFRLLFATI